MLLCVKGHISCDTQFNQQSLKPINDQC